MTEKERIDDLERRVKELEKQIARQIPWRDKLGPKPGDEPMWPDDPFKLPPSPKWPDNIDEWKCSVCGIRRDPVQPHGPVRPSSLPARRTPTDPWARAARPFVDTRSPPRGG